MNKSLAPIILIMFISLVPAHAGTKLTYAECENLLLQNNKDLKIIENSLVQSEYDKKLSLSGFLPSLSFTSSVSDTSLSGETVSKKIYSNSLDLSQNLFSGFQDISRYNSAKLSYEKSSNNLTQSQRAQIAELKIAFSNLQLTQRLYDFTLRTIKTRQDIKDLVSLKFSSGSETKDSLLFAEGQLEEAKLESINVKNDIENARRKLKNLLGNKVDDQVEVEGKIPVFFAIQNPELSELSLKTFEVKNALLDQKIAEEDSNLNRGKFLPSLDLIISREIENKRNYSSLVFNQNNYTVVKLRLTIPLFDSYTTYYDYKKSGLEIEKTKFTLAKIQVDQLRQLKSIYEKSIELKKRKEIYQKYLEAAKLREEINTAKYRLGLIRFDTWIDSQNDLISYEKNVIQIDLEIDTNSSKWESLVNGQA